MLINEAHKRRQSLNAWPCFAQSTVLEEDAKSRLWHATRLSRLGISGTNAADIPAFDDRSTNLRRQGR
jgi:hypothetical protein